MADADLDRRFGGLRRLYGVEAAQRLFDAHMVVVGIGGVGSWVAEALARSGVSRLTLIDMDHVAESNINRQVHALDTTVGQSKVQAMSDRVAQIHPGCRVNLVDDFVTPENWPGLLPPSDMPDVVVDACDNMRAKTALATWAIRSQTPFVTVGAAGGKTLAHRVEVADLLDVTHDPLLARLRYQLRRSGVVTKDAKRAQVCCVFSREAVAGPDASCAAGGVDGSLNCHGYGSSVAVTATFGMAAAAWAMSQVSATKKPSGLQKTGKTAL
jgi:tRNA A37 threonylcarbamoyladenosine dehydratase